MAIYASSKGGSADFELCPAGTQQLVCCDIVDHGEVKVRYGNKERMQHKITIRWLSAEHKTKEGKPMLVQRRFTCSLHPQAALRKYLDVWRGRPFSAAEADKFDLEKLIGINAIGQVVHEQKPRGTFAEVVACVPLLRNMTAAPVDEAYIRVTNRPQDQQQDGATGEPPAELADYDDSDVPF